jgi:hypothetical protein
MPFTLPTFNLTCHIFTWVNPPGPTAPPRSSPACNLQFARRLNEGQPTEISWGFPPGVMYLLLGAGTDIRSVCCYPGVNQTDIVECPSGSGRIYLVQSVDDVGKGFTNEYRCAIVTPTQLFGVWPSPIP